MRDTGGALAARNITKSYGAEVVLDRISLTVTARARLGVVGPNGSGKSTLLRILAGLEAPDGGDVVRRPAGLEVRYLPQEPDGRANEPLLDLLARKTGIAAAEQELDALAARLESEPELATAYTEALERFLALGGEDFHARARQISAEVGLDAGRLGQAPATMSGGEAARASLAAILLSRFDVLLLDEPTNNLDFAGLELLERFVETTPSALVLVSHDRAFLERTVRGVIEFEAETRRVREFAGSWADYERARAASERQHRDAYGSYVEERDRFGALLSTRRREAQAGGAMADRRGTHALSSKVRAAGRMLERLERVDKPWQPWRLELALDQRQRGGDVIARLQRAVVSRGDFMLGPVDLELRAGDRLAVVGANGSGKTTLVEMLAGTMSPDEGVAFAGRSTHFGRLDQDRGEFAGSDALLDTFVARTELAPTEARTVLAKFALGEEDVLRPAKSLSPGERTRATLALLTARGANALLLDEPTNHLDLEAIEQLEAALDGFPGAIVLVTHDRRLLERFRATRVVELERGRLRER